MSNDIFLYEVPAFDNPNDICLRITDSAQGGGIGLPGKRYTKDQLDKILAEQRPFTRQKYEDDLKAAELAAAKAADATRNKKKRQALEAAADAASEIYYEIEKIPRAEIERLTEGLTAAAGAARVRDAIAYSERVVALARLIAEAHRLENERDEEEIIMMLLS